MELYNCHVCHKMLPKDNFHISRAKPNGIIGRCKECDKSYSRKYLKKRSCSAIKLKILEKYGSKCVDCGFSDPRALQVDHVNGGGKKHIATYKGNYRNYYKDVLRDTEGRFQILCANCNWIKRYVKSECKNDIKLAPSTQLI